MILDIESVACLNRITAPGDARGAEKACAGLGGGGRTPSPPPSSVACTCTTTFLRFAAADLVRVHQYLSVLGHHHAIRVVPRPVVLLHVHLGPHPGVRGQCGPAMDHGYVACQPPGRTAVPCTRPLLSGWWILYQAAGGGGLRVGGFVWVSPDFPQGTGVSALFGGWVGC